MMAKRAIILAAGRGSRLGALTARRPKCLQHVAGRCLLDWQRSALRSAGVADIRVVVGYRAELLTKRSVLRTVPNPRWETTGPIGSLLCAVSDHVTEDFLVVYADCVFHPDLISELQSVDAPIAITSDLDWQRLWSTRFDDVLLDAECLREERGWLTAIGGRADSVAEIKGQFTGLVKFSPAGWREVQRFLASVAPAELARLDMTALLSAVLARGTPIGVAPVRGRWCEVDSQTDLAVYRRSLRRRGWSHDWRWRS